MDIEKGQAYDIIVFPCPDDGLKAQRLLLCRHEDFKHISSLAVVVSRDRRPQVCRVIAEGGVLISGYYPFVSRDEKDFFERVRDYVSPGSEAVFLKGLTLSYVAPCMADEKKIRLIAFFHRHIAGVLPYLNAVIKGASYNKSAPALTFAKGRRLINLYDTRVTIAKADDIIDAWKILDEIKDLINQTYEQRSSLKPNEEEKVKVTALQIYGWLPKTNCGLCQEATCLAFAMKLLQGEQRLSQCRPLSMNAEFSATKAILEEMAQALGVA